MHPYLQPDALKDINHLFDTQIMKQWTFWFWTMHPRIEYSVGHLLSKVESSLPWGSTVWRSQIMCLQSVKNSDGYNQDVLVLFWNRNKKHFHITENIKRDLHQREREVLARRSSTKCCCKRREEMRQEVSLTKAEWIFWVIFRKVSNSSSVFYYFLKHIYILGLK